MAQQEYLARRKVNVRAGGSRRRWGSQRNVVRGWGLGGFAEKRDAAFGWVGEVATSCLCPCPCPFPGRYVCAMGTESPPVDSHLLPGSCR